MTNQAERIQNAINHIKTATDIDPWAMEIAVEALEKEIPMRVKITTSTKRCGRCGTAVQGAFRRRVACR